MTNTSIELVTEHNWNDQLGVQLQNFQTTLDALQDFLDVIAPQVNALDEQRHFGNVMERMLSQLSGEQLDQAQDDLTKFSQALGQAIKTAEETEGLDGDAQDLPTQHIAVSEDSARIIAATAQAAIAQPKLPILFRSIIPMAIGAFEVLVGYLITGYYNIRPGLLPKEEKEFSLADLEQFTTIKDAFDDAVQRRVDNILNGGLDEWTKWFSRRGIEIDVSKLAIHWPQTVELFQRRHIIVHNAGRVSKRYLTKLKDHHSNLPNVGAEIATDAEYVQKALDSLNVTGYLLAASVWKQLSGDDRDTGMSTRLRRRVDDLIRLERWRAAQQLCRTLKSFKEFQQAARFTFQCEEWLCTKNIEGIDAVRPEIEGWDASALGQRFQAMKYELLDMHDRPRTLSKGLLLAKR